MQGLEKIPTNKNEEIRVSIVYQINRGHLFLFHTVLVLHGSTSKTPQNQHKEKGEENQ
jgi:hypothetical protein